MKKWFQPFIGGWLLLNAAFVGANATSDCDAPELMDGQVDYNRIVCDASEKMNDLAFEEAAFLYEKALAIPLFATPNFELLPKLALAYFLSGNKEKADKIMLKSKLTLSVFSGLLKCEETKKGFFLSQMNGVLLTDPTSKATAAIMCGAAYDYLYHRQGLDRVFLEGELVKNYFEIRKKIDFVQ